MSSKFITIVLAIVCAAALSPAAIVGADEKLPASRDSWQTRYQWQLEEYGEIRAQFPDAIRQQLEQKTVPLTKEERYRWQLEEYKELNKAFADDLAKNTEPNPVPAGEDEQYQWQLQPYKDLNAQFHDSLMHNLKYKERPFTP